MICQTIFSNGTREWIIFGQDPNKPSNLIDTNQILITEGSQGVLVDPGSFEIFPTLLAAISKEFAVDGIAQIFFSHQDPDVVSSLPLWQQISSRELSVSVSEIYADSLSHLNAHTRLAIIPDTGDEISFGKSPALRAVPAHYLYSPGNFHLYDPTAKILYTGKVGTAIIPPGQNHGFIVEDFIDHVDYMSAFHQRWMPSKEARNFWLHHISDIKIDTLVPHSGLIFQGNDVDRFLDWFSDLQLASAIQTAYPEQQASAWDKHDPPKGEPEPGGGYRLITRGSLDGIVCAVILKKLQMIDDILFIEPKDLLNDSVDINENDILANLPYQPSCHLSFDHHSSEISRLGKIQPNHIINPTAPSAARVIYEYYGCNSLILDNLDLLMDAVDKCDSAQFTMSEVLRPEGWSLLHFIIDPRTGFSRFRGFRIPHYELIMNLIDWCGEYSVDEILEMRDVKERADLYLQHEKMFKEQIERCAEINGNLILLNYLDEETIYVGNRFMVYAMFPQCNISIHQMWGSDTKKIVFACGKSIFDRSAKTNVGDLMLRFEGGGHIAAGACQVEPRVAERVKQELIQKINADG